MATKSNTPQKSVRRAQAAKVDPLAESRRVIAQYEKDHILTANGKPLDPLHNHDHRNLPFKYTDQGVAMANIEGEREPGSVAVRDTFDHQLDARIAAGKGNLQPWEAPEPLSEMLAPHIEPGFSYRYLSPRHLNKGRGKRGFEIVLDNEGNQVKCADMILARMPISTVEKRNAYYRGLGETARASAEETQREHTNSLIRKAKAVGIEPLRSGDTARDHESHGDSVATIGVRSHRGNSAFPDQGA